MAIYLKNSSRYRVSVNGASVGNRIVTRPMTLRDLNVKIAIFEA